MSTYCGIGKVPAGKKRGTAEECLKKNQVRYYGIKRYRRSELEKQKRVNEINRELEAIQLKVNILVQRFRKIPQLIEAHERQMSKERRTDESKKRNRESIAKLKKEQTRIKARAVKIRDKREALETELEGLV